MQNYLSEEEVVKIEKMCEDEVLLGAVKKVLLQSAYTHGVNQAGFKAEPLLNGALSLAALSTNNPIPDEVLGQHIRGVWAGVNALENGFKDLESIKSKKEEAIESPYNEAV